MCISFLKIHLLFGKGSPFSQWLPARFEVDGITYNCAEQYMMYHKAVLFRDKAVAIKILEECRPKGIQGPSGEWSEEYRKIVKGGNLAKV
jgi:ribA/ribD-fused uncharacterized protein